jgi:nucleoside-diphosphate-sugar epimerase
MNLRGVPVLVTGGSGFVGSRIASWLAKQGADVRAVVRKIGPHPGLDSPNIRQVQGDFSDPLMARYACGARELVFHAAATIGKDLSEALHVNVTGTAVLAGAARVAGCQRFIHISTLSVYDFQSGRDAFSEDAPLRMMGKTYAHSPAATPHYGITKAEAERALRVEMAEGLPATIFRLGAVLGMHPTSSWAMKVPAKVRAGKVPVLGDGSDIMPWTHVDNVTHAIGLALDRSESIGRAYNVVDGDVAWKDFIEDMRSWFPDAPPAPVIPAAAVKPGDKFIGHCPNDRLVAELGYKPVRSYFEGMGEAGAWWRKNAGKV